RRSPSSLVCLPPPPPPRPTLFPYTTLFRSRPARPGAGCQGVLRVPVPRRVRDVPAVGAAARRGDPCGPDPRARGRAAVLRVRARSEEHTSELQSRFDLVCRLLLEKKKEKNT